MNTTYKYLGYTIFLCSFFLSCKERIDIPLQENINKLVIEGEVHDQAGPYFVKISKSTAFNNNLVFLAHNPNYVVISDNEGNVDTLTKMSDGIYKTNTLVGKVGNTYYLTVNDNGNLHSAQSVLNPCPTIDSAYFYQFLRPENKNPTVKFKDNSTNQDYYRYFSRINRKPAKNMYVFEDILINGTDWRLSTFRDEIKKGDTVEMFLLGIDKANFNYFEVLVQNQAAVTGGNEEAAPNNPSTNISGNVLGYFSAHGKKSVTLIAKD